MSARCTGTREHRAPVRSKPLRSKPLRSKPVRRTLTSGGLALSLAGGLLVGTAVSPAATPASAMVSAQLEKHAVKIARGRKGALYSYGATGPHRFDCSGLTRWVYHRLGKKLPHSSSAQARKVKRIRRKDARPGDLVFFYGYGGGVYHVAIYAGHHRIWHAPYTGTRVRLDRIWTNHYFFGRVR